MRYKTLTASLAFAGLPRRRPGWYTNLFRGPIWAGRQFWRGDFVVMPDTHRLTRSVHSDPPPELCAISPWVTAWYNFKK